MDVSSFAELEADFAARTNRIVWCTFATIDRRGRPRSRMLHPVWELGERPVGWIATGRTSHKAVHLEANPNVSCTYWDPGHEQAHADCLASWADDQPTRHRVWALLRDTPPPVGYDPGLFWPDGPDSPGYGALRLDPWRVEVWSLADLIGGREPRVWRAPDRSGA